VEEGRGAPRLDVKPRPGVQDPHPPESKRGEKKRGKPRHYPLSTPEETRRRENKGFTRSFVQDKSKKQV